MSEKKGLFGGLFGGGKKSGCCDMQIVENTDESAGCCGPGCDCGAEESAPFIEGAMSIKILGPGCKNCVALTENTKLALAQMKLEANIEKVDDMSAIAGYGIMSTPGLVVNEKVVSFGKVLKPNDIIALLEKELK